MAEFEGYDLDDHQDLQNSLFNRQLCDPDCPGCTEVRRLLVYASELRGLIDCTIEENLRNIGAHQALGVRIAKMALESMEDIYLSLLHGHYLSGYRSSRYLFECFLILRGINRDPQKAADIWDTYILETEAMVGDKSEWPLFPYEHIDSLSSIQDAEFSHFQRRHGDFNILMNGLSNEGNHPYRIENAFNQGEHIPAQEFDVASLGIWLFVGISMEFMNVLGRENVPEGAFDEICSDADNIVGRYDILPVIMADYYDLGSLNDYWSE